MFAKQVTWWFCPLYIFITREFIYLSLRKAATPKYLDQVNLILKTFQWPWFRSYSNFGSTLIWSEYLVRLNHILTPTFEHFDKIRPRRPHRDPQKFIFRINKYVGEMVIMNDLEWAMLSYYVFYYKSSEKSCIEQRMKL